MSRQGGRLIAALVITLLVSACGGATPPPSAKPSATSTVPSAAAVTATARATISPSPTVTVSEAAAEYLAIANGADAQLTRLGFWTAKKSEASSDREAAQTVLAALTQARSRLRAFSWPSSTAAAAADLIRAVD